MDIEGDIIRRTSSGGSLAMHNMTWEVLHTVAKVVKQRRRLRVLRDDWHSTCRTVEDINNQQAGVVHLNVGGSIFHVGDDTLQRRGTALADMAAGVFAYDLDMATGSVFIDRDPFHFAAVLTFLRTGFAFHAARGAERAAFEREARFYCVQLRPKRQRIYVGGVPMGPRLFPGHPLVYDVDAHVWWDGGDVGDWLSDEAVINQHHVAGDGHLYRFGARVQDTLSVLQVSTERWLPMLQAEDVPLGGHTDFPCATRASSLPLSQPTGGSLSLHDGRLYVFGEYPVGARNLWWMLRVVTLSTGARLRGIPSNCFNLLVRTGMATCFVGDLLFSVGGCDWNASTTDFVGTRCVERWSNALQHWVPIPLMPFWTTCAAAAAWEGRLLVVGGVHMGVVLRSVCVYDPVCRTWHQLTPLSTARMRCALAVLPMGDVVAIGGLGGRPGAYEWLTSVELYDVHAECWVPLPSMPVPLARLAALAVGFK